MSGRERIVEMGAAFDKRDPDPKKNYGIHGVDLRMILKGPEGAVQFVLYTNWQLPHVTREQHARILREGIDDIGLSIREPLPADLGYHSPVPRYEGQEPIGGDCEYTGGTCYYDGSGLNAKGIYEKLLTGGSDAVWAALEEYYNEVFETSEVHA